MWRIEDKLPPYAKAKISIEQMISKLQPEAKLQSENAMAKKLGISRPTVRKAIAELVEEGILCARRGSGTYLVEKPKTEARGAGKRMIGLLVPSIINTLIARIVKGAADQAYLQGYATLFSHHDYPNPKEQLERLEKLLEQDISGLLVFAETDMDFQRGYLELFEKAKSKGVETVLLDHPFPGTDLPCVMADNVKGLQMATKHLIALGRRKFALLSFGARCAELHRLRKKGFSDALAEGGLKPEPVREAELGVEGHEAKAREAVGSWIRAAEGRPPFDAIVCMEDNMAYGAFMAVKDAGLRVPEDIAIIGHDNLDSELFRSAGLELSSVDQPAEEIGSEAAKLLIASIEKTKRRERASRVLLKPKLVVRGSCGAKLQSPKSIAPAT